MSDVYPSTGFVEIDEEHRALGQVAMRLFAAVRDDDRAAAEPCLVELIAGTLEHFEHEERWMRSIGYPAYLRHKAVHDAYAGRAQLALEALRKDGISAAFLRWVANLPEWFETHVTTEDLWLGMALNEALSARAGAAAAAAVAGSR